MRLEVFTQAQFDFALKADKFKTVTDFWAYNLPGVTEFPAMPNVTTFRVYNLPGVTEFPAMPNVMDFLAFNLPGVTEFPAMPNVMDFWADHMPQLPPERPKHINPRCEIYRNGRVWR